jgi:hypothetical protein
VKSETKRSLDRAVQQRLSRGCRSLLRTHRESPDTAARAANRLPSDDDSVVLAQLVDQVLEYERISPELSHFGRARLTQVKVDLAETIHSA